MHPREQFSLYVQKHLSLPFDWETNNCVTFSIGWGQTVTGENYFSAYPKWKTKDDAERNVRSVGGLESEFDKLFTRIEPNFANDGDLTVVNGCAMLFSASEIVAPSEQGLKFLSRMEAKCAWRF